MTVANIAMTVAKNKQRRRKWIPVKRFLDADGEAVDRLPQYIFGKPVVHQEGFVRYVA